MKITYNQNPLLTTIELNDHEKQILWYKIKIEQMENKLFSTYFYLKDGKYFDLQRAQQEVEPEYYCINDKSSLDKRTDELLQYYLDALIDTHIGDCTCVACSCDKCHAEDLIGINTLLGLEQHCASKINNAFGKDNKKTIEEALHYLKQDNLVTENSSGYEQSIEKGKEEKNLAYEWLFKYKEEHFNIFV